MNNVLNFTPSNQKWPSQSTVAFRPENKSGVGTKKKKFRRTYKSPLPALTIKKRIFRPVIWWKWHTLTFGSRRLVDWLHYRTSHPFVVYVVDNGRKQTRGAHVAKAGVRWRARLFTLCCYLFVCGANVADEMDVLQCNAHGECNARLHRRIINHAISDAGKINIRLKWDASSVAWCVPNKSLYALF